MLAAGLIAHKFAALDPRLAQAGQKYAQLKNGLSAKTTQTLHGRTEDGPAGTDQPIDIQPPVTDKG
jgi:hypothetical protein